MQTIAANLGSMLTPIGNPQNLYLYGKSGMSTGEFVLLMLPYTLVSLLLLLAWAALVCRKASAALSVDAVSYTHLDVYKRQLYSESSLRFS